MGDAFDTVRNALEARTARILVVHDPGRLVRRMDRLERIIRIVLSSFGRLRPTLSTWWRETRREPNNMSKTGSLTLIVANM